MLRTHPCFFLFLPTPHTPSFVVIKTRLKMRGLSYLTPLVALSIAGGSLAAVVSHDMHIVNGDVSPDGFTRKFVVFKD